MHSLQIATAGVGPATIRPTSVPRFPQNEHLIESSDRGGPAPGGGGGGPAVAIGPTVPRGNPSFDVHNSSREAG
jgi:hypothetical protein